METRNNQQDSGEKTPIKVSLSGKLESVNLFIDDMRKTECGVNNPDFGVVFFKTIDSIPLEIRRLLLPRPRRDGNRVNLIKKEMDVLILIDAPNYQLALPANCKVFTYKEGMPADSFFVSILVEMGVIADPALMEEINHKTTLLCAEANNHFNKTSEPSLFSMLPKEVTHRITNDLVQVSFKDKPLTCRFFYATLHKKNEVSEKEMLKEKYDIR